MDPQEDDTMSDNLRSKAIRLAASLPPESTERHVLLTLLREGGHPKTAGMTMYHLTDRAKFKLDPKKMPRDNSVSIEDRSGRAGIYLGKNVEGWVNGYGYWRPFVVEFDVDPSVKDDPGVHGRYGGEMFIPAASFDKLTIKRVIPLDAHAREEYGEYGWIEDALEREFDTGNPIKQRGMLEPYQRPFPGGYHYTGPDVREMSSTETARLMKDLKKVKRTH
jgi:hypothetical protein